MMVASREESPPLIILCGPTAAGKTALSMEVARRFPIEIISADSRQVYRGMDIGTAKATLEERRRVPHHLIDVADPDQNFTAAEFARMGRQAVAEIRSRGRMPMIVGGTGLYIRTLTEGLLDAPGPNESMRRMFSQLESEGGEETLLRELEKVDPVLAARLHPGDRARIIRGLEVFALTGRPLSTLQREHAFGDRPFRLLKIGVTVEREELYRRIDQRVGLMLSAGLLEETRGLLDQGYAPELKALRTIGYAESILHLSGIMSLEQTADQIRQNTRRYAKRQMTWFRADSSIIWVDSSRESARIHGLIENFYAEYKGAADA